MKELPLEKLQDIDNETFDEHSDYKQPEKLIDEAKDMEPFRLSKAYVRLVSYVQALNAACTGIKDYHVHYSSRVANVLDVLEQVQEITDSVSLEPGRHRFGNPAFRRWHAKLLHRAPTILDTIVPSSLGSAQIELLDYFLGSFGNAQRIDFGTGHELNFLGFLKGLDLLNLLTYEDCAAVGLYVSHKYLEVCRKLVIKYRLEPAGSHGVWGLDDHFFIPYIFGSSQLAAPGGNTLGLRPTAILDKKLTKELSKSNLYFSAIDFINVMKKGPFYEHSPILYDITAVPSWSKVNQGLLKMYDVEVLSKYPVVQHFHFGNLFPFQQFV
ncbi:serine/threonine protein phosphatase PP2A regulatory subunit, PTPA family Ypa1 [Schizosaccharomyces osmophilus]|uniref:Serine/threonine-protein phosphatase 2A activator n=1 Tax=Schizosaccharomyces osmophilus TaxID=2545709 RepID=A0AAF0AXW4_9SCHI|nr:serine/threonine protein phosphatase PP2A regulatory subunit, PTPA family Ypa1 [Schizosaccharomyces osmophilus]WBW74328.1 serine/threonine protein phosphatase PP2A regulatory subunit, PTPA family Ypa1 [Schizosaccharomyces osmophilus]